MKYNNQIIRKWYLSALKTPKNYEQLYVKIKTCMDRQAPCELQLQPKKGNLLFLGGGYFCLTPKIYLCLCGDRDGRDGLGVGFRLFTGCKKFQKIQVKKI